jgi:hypothetical protein
VQRKSPHIFLSGLVAALALLVSTAMAAATASMLGAIVIFIIAAVVGVLGWGCVFLNHLRVEQSWCDHLVTIRDHGTVNETRGPPIAYKA